MTKITIIATPSEEDATVGFEPKVLVEMDNIDDATSLAYYFSVTARSLGYTYVESVILMDNKDRTWDSEEYQGSSLGD